jgi:hypothetical protein
MIVWDVQDVVLVVVVEVAAVVQVVVKQAVVTA